MNGFYTIFDYFLMTFLMHFCCFAVNAEILKTALPLQLECFPAKCATLEQLTFSVMFCKLFPESPGQSFRHYFWALFGRDLE